MDYAQQLAFFANILEQKRLVTALEGNASMIDRNAGLTYITPSGRMKLLLQKEDISVMGENGTQVGGRGEAVERISAARGRLPDTSGRKCRCALPLPVSDSVCTAVSGLHRPRELLTACRVPALCLSALRQNGTHEIHRGIETALSDSPVCLLGGHGVVCVSNSMESCIGLLEAAEGLAKTLWLAGQI